MVKPGATTDDDRSLSVGYIIIPFHSIRHSTIFAAQINFIHINY